MTRPLLYVAGPVREALPSDVALISKARRLAFQAGWVPVWGLFLLDDLGLTEERDRAAIMAADLAMLRKCDALLLVGERVTQGMRLEIDLALELGIPIYVFSDQNGIWSSSIPMPA